MMAVKFVLTYTVLPASLFGGNNRIPIFDAEI